MLGYIQLRRQHKYNFYYSLRSSMSFTNVIRERNANRQEELNCMNPINKINLGLRKAATSQRASFVPPNHQPVNQSYPQQMSFSSLSKQKNQHYSSQVRLKHIDNSNSSFSKTSNLKVETKVKQQLKYDNLQRRLFDDSKRVGDESKENKLNFTNVIKNSRQKSLKRGSLSKKQEQKVIKPPMKQRRHLNTLKNRLIGHKEQPIESVSSSSKKAVGETTNNRQMVRISIESIRLKESLELDMSPCL